MSGSLALQPAYCASIYAFLLCHARHRASLSGVLAAVPRDVALLIAQRVRAKSRKHLRSYAVFYRLYATNDLDVSDIEKVVHCRKLFDADSISIYLTDDEAFLQVQEQFFLCDARDTERIYQHVLDKKSRLEECFCILTSGVESGVCNVEHNDYFLPDDSGGDFEDFEDMIRDELSFEDDIPQWRTDVIVAALCWFSIAGCRVKKSRH